MASRTPDDGEMPWIPAPIPECGIFDASVAGVDHDDSFFGSSGWFLLALGSFSELFENAFECILFLLLSVYKYLISYYI